MKLDLKAITLTSGILWAALILLTGIMNLVWTGYGEAFLKIMASLYPGFNANGSLGDVVIGTVYALFDGAACGFVFGWVYNIFAGKKSAPE